MNPLLLILATMLLAPAIWSAPPPPPPLPGLTGLPLPTIILRQPANVLVADGGTASFSISITGAPPLRCQWRKDGVELPGKTNTGLTIRNAAGSDAGDYTAVLTNNFSGATSAPARLRLKVPVPDSTDLVYFGRTSGLPEDWWTEGYGWQSNTVFLPHNFAHNPNGGTGRTASVRIDVLIAKTNAEVIFDWTDTKTNLWYPFHIVTWTNTEPGWVTWVNANWDAVRPGYFRVHEKLDGDRFSMVYPP